MEDKEMNQITKIIKAETPHKVGDWVYHITSRKIERVKITNITLNLWGDVQLTTKRKKEITQGSANLFFTSKKDAANLMIKTISKTMKKYKKDMR